MAKTKKPEKNGRPSAEVVAQQRALIAGAAETRRVEQQRIEQERSTAITTVNENFVTVIKKARDQKVPWEDLVAAAGINRVTLGQLVRKHG